MRVMTEATYQERRDYYRDLGRREARLYGRRRLLAFALIAGLMLGGLGVVNSHAAGGGRVESPEQTHTKWALRFVQGQVGDHTALTARCVNRRCAVWSPDHQTEFRIVVMANGRFRVTEALVPDLSLSR